MGPVGCTKGVVDIDIRQPGQGLCKVRVVFLLFFMKSEVFKQEHLSWFQRIGHRFDLGPHAVRCHLDRCTQEIRQGPSDRIKTHGRNSFALGPAQVGSKDKSGPLIQSISDRGQCGFDARGISHLSL